MEPFYFGHHDALFGIYHPPKSVHIYNVGIVLCYPIGQEYIRCHHSFLYLAKFLASNGFHVLRFDYYGSGDSYGEYEQSSLESRIENISTAVDELKGSEIEDICLIGLRLGAALAILCGMKRDDIDSMILWEPIISGKKYIREQTQLHIKWLQGSFARCRKYNRRNQYSQEVLGYPLTDSFFSDNQSIDISTIPRPPAKKVLIIDTDHKTQNQYLHRQFEMFGIQTDYDCTGYPKTWVKSSAPSRKDLVPVQLLQRIATWINGKYE